MQADHWSLQPEPAACIAKLDEAINRQGLSALQFMPMFLSTYEQYEDWDAPGFKPFWDAVAEMAIPVFFTLAPRSATVDSYIDELEGAPQVDERHTPTSWSSSPMALAGAPSAKATR